MTDSDKELLELMEQTSIDYVYGIYAEGLLRHTGVNVDVLEEETKQDVIAKMKDRIYDIFSQYMLDEIPPEKTKEIEEKTKRGEDANPLIAAALSEQSVNITELALRALSSFADTYLDANGL